MTEAEQAIREIDRRMAQEAPHLPVRETVFPRGTILSCGDCGEGLYKVTVRATTADIILDDGTILQPLNLTIPRRDVWKSLACIKCGGRISTQGKLHTVQEGWK